MNKYTKFTTILLIIATIICISGCNFINNLFRHEVPEENLIIYSGRGVKSYEYSKKVRLAMDTADDSLSILTNKEDGSWSCILYGSFEKFVHYSDQLIIFSDEKYYVFNVNDYKIPENGEKPEYELKEYSKSEFVDVYPEYTTFNWETVWSD